MSKKLVGSQIKVARNAGFCFGVERAIRMALNAKPLNGRPPTYILGALVHNPLVTAELTRQGFIQVDSWESVESGRVILPSHGVAPSVRKGLMDRGIEIIDATCPFVARAQRDVQELSRAGRRIIIVGDRGHREVIGLAGHSAAGVEVINSVPEAVELTNRLPSDTAVAVIAQTTQNQVAFELIVEVLESYFDDIIVRNTICTATSDRQQGVVELASQVDVMIVVGGRNSANTRRLYEISRSLGVKTYLIESADELDEVVVAGGTKVGVAAGASTPGWAIKEVVNKMENKIMGLNGQVEKTVSGNAEQVSVNANEAENVGQAAGQLDTAGSLAQQQGSVQSGQQQGGASKASATGEPGQVLESTGAGELESGQAVEGVESTPEADQVEVPQKSAQASPSEEVTSMTEVLKSEYVPQEGEIIKGKVVQITSDEVLVDIGYKSEAVIPLKELSVRPIANPSEAVSVGDEVYCVVLSVDSDGEGSVILSKKRADLIRAWERVETAFNEGTPVRGKVTEVVKGGVIVDIGLRGFVPASQIDLRRVSDLNSVVGKELTMKVLEVEKERNNVVLSQRAFLEERLAEAKKRAFDTLKEGDIVDGTVTRLTNFGAFVDIGDGVEGLLHVSDISWNRITHPGQVLKEGDKIKVMVLSVDPERERISLGLKQTQKDPWAEAQTKYPVGTVINGTVTRLTDFGAFVDIGKGVEGLLHVSDISWNRITHPGQVLKVGDKIKVMVLGVDAERRRMSLGLKQTLDDPWVKVPTKYPVGTVTDGKVTRLTDFGAFVELEPGIEGLVHVSQISRHRVEKPSDVLQEGQMVQVKVISLKLDQRRIGLSIKEVENEISSYRSNSTSSQKHEEPTSGATIGELVGDILKQHDFTSDSGDR